MESSPADELYQSDIKLRFEFNISLYHHALDTLLLTYKTPTVGTDFSHSWVVKVIEGTPDQLNPHVSKPKESFGTLVKLCLKTERHISHSLPSSLLPKMRSSRKGG